MQSTEQNIVVVLEVIGIIASSHLQMVDITTNALTIISIDLYSSKWSYRGYRYAYLDCIKYLMIWP